MANISIETNQFNDAAKFCKSAYEYNTSLLSGKTNAQFDVTLKAENMLLYGINLSIIIGDKDLFFFFFVKILPQTIPGDDYKIIELYHSIFSNEPIKVFDLPTQKISLSILVHRLNNYIVTDSKIKLLQSLYNHFKNNFEFLFYYAGVLSKENQTTKAIAILEETHLLNKTSPEVMLQLITLYSQINNFNKVLETARKAKNIFSSIPNVAAQFKAIEDKILSFLK